ncbi:MAG: DAK2 domain-containing protein [Chloroflexi bacterium]|nr:DAK2 domain-containing protein [Chloroflexota bacterium]
MTEQTLATVTHRSSVLSVDGQEFRQMIRAALTWLQHHQGAINKLNVYPVPDGDTGTNMVLTMQSAWEEINHADETSVGKVAHRMAHGALMGARGNSGVILSQIWRGFARSLDDKHICRAKDLADALQEAATTAYKGVVKPVEGTILTVSRSVADAAAQAAGMTDDIAGMLEQVTFAAHEAVALTPSLLPVLREAGVVDAGGQGLYIILQGMLFHARRDPILERALDSDSSAESVIVAPEPAEIGYGYDVQFLVVGEHLDMDTIRQTIVGMGDSALVVGDSSTIKVHVHVPDPGIPLSYGAGLGSLRDVVVEDMQAQYQDFLNRNNGQLGQGEDSSRSIAVVAVTQGEGLGKVFESLGADAIVPGGQTMNPSTKDLLEAIEHLPYDQIILLPNNSNVVLAAEQARSLSDRNVVVIPTHSIPQGVAALLVLNHQTSLESNEAAMLAAMDEVQTGEITVATRSATINGISVLDGQIIGLHNGEMAVSGASIDRVALDLLAKMNPSQAEIITLYYGDAVSEGEATVLAEFIQEQWPDLEVECVDGGQPHYHYILSVE